MLFMVCFIMYYMPRCPRLAGDLLCRGIAEYAEYEKWNPTLREGMTHFAEILSAVQDYREAQVK